MRSLARPFIKSKSHYNWIYFIIWPHNICVYKDKATVSNKQFNLDTFTLNKLNGIICDSLYIFTQFDNWIGFNWKWFPVAKCVWKKNFFFLIEANPIVNYCRINSLLLLSFSLSRRISYVFVCSGCYYSTQNEHFNLFFNKCVF